MKIKVCFCFVYMLRVLGKSFPPQVVLFLLRTRNLDLLNIAPNVDVGSGDETW